MFLTRVEHKMDKIIETMKFVLHLQQIGIKSTEPYKYESVAHAYPV